MIKPGHVPLIVFVMFMIWMILAPAHVKRTGVVYEWRQDEINYGYNPATGRIDPRRIGQ